MQLEEKLITLKKVTFFFVYHLNRKNIKRLFLLSQLSFSFAKETLDCVAIACGCGEIGRRTRFRFWRRKAWGFKSLHPHQTGKTNLVTLFQNWVENWDLCHKPYFVKRFGRKSSRRGLCEVFNISDANN